jgi:hypothetical protein
MPRAAMACSVNTPVPCGEPAVRGGRCAGHAAAAEGRRGSSAARGYGARHQRVRTRLLRQRRLVWAAFERGEADLQHPLLWCPRCSESIAPIAVRDDDLHADHFGTRPPADADRLAHAACNIGAATHQRGPQT